MALGMKHNRRNNKVFIWGLGAHFGFPLNDYSFYYPPPSWFIPHLPPEGGDSEAQTTIVLHFLDLIGLFVMTKGESECVTWVLV